MSGETRFAKDTWKLKLRLKRYDGRILTCNEMVANAARLGLTHEHTLRVQRLDRAIEMRAKIATELLRREMAPLTKAKKGP